MPAVETAQYFPEYKCVQTIFDNKKINVCVLQTKLKNHNSCIDDNGYCCSRGGGGLNEVFHNSDCVADH